MKTILFPAPLAIDAIDQSAVFLRTGGLVVFPTETVYGLGANAFDEHAVRKIFVAKGRPADNPLIVHIADVGMVDVVSTHVSAEARRLLALFSPGPLTVICPRHPDLAPSVTAGLPTVGVRIPAHPVARALLASAGVPVAAPSANPSGRPSPTTFEMAVRDMSGRVDAIVDGGVCEHGLESTVVMVEREEVVILRPGSVTEEMIEHAGFSVRAISHRKNAQPLAPGMKYTHYKPHADVFLSRDFPLPFIAQHFGGKTIALIGIRLPETSLKTFSFPDTKTYAKHLFATFALCEREGIDVIIIEAVEEKGIGKALMNRLRKASGNVWIEDML